MPISIDDIRNGSATEPNERLIPADAARSVATYTIRSDGSDVSRTYHVASILAHRELNRIPFATVIIEDGDPASESFPVSNTDDFRPGRELEILLGYRSEEQTVFKGIVVKHGIKVRKGHAVLIVECRDVAVKLTAVPKMKYSYDITDSSAIEEIIYAYGIQSEVESTDVTHKELVQYNATDWDFICCRADATGMLVNADEGTIRVGKPDLKAASALNIQFGATVLDLDAEIDARLQFPKVSSNAWNPEEAALETAEAADPGVAETGNLTSGNLADVIGADSFALHHGGAVPQAELQQWADSKQLRHKLAKVRGTVTVDGTAAVKPGQMIELRGAGERFEGKLFVTAVRQHLSEGMWRTSFQFGLDPAWFAQRYDVPQPLAGALLPPIQGLHIGVVTSLEDPDHAGRIRVRLPLIAEQEDGIWSRLATLDAGNNRGTFVLPEIGDEVILGFINNDPRHAVVLGMLNSAHHPAPLNASNDNNEKGYVSRSEMKFIFNDDKKSIVLETPAGNKITLDEDQTLLKLEDQNGNSIAMDSSGIVISSAGDIGLQAPQGKIQMKDMAGNSLALETSGLSVGAAAKLTLKGAMIELNGAQLSASAGMASFSGVVNAQTVIATVGVVSPSYTPGAGNLM